MESKNCYATYRKDVRKSCSPFRIRVTAYAKLRTERPNNSPISCREQVNALMHHLHKKENPNKWIQCPMKNQFMELTF